MINNDTAKSTYTVTEGVTEYPIGFQYTTNPDGTPNLYVWYGDNTELEYGTGYTLSDDGLSIVLLSPIEADETLTIAVDEPFIQDSDYVIGRIDPEQIERDFDKSVLRDLELRDYADDINDRLADEVQARSDADTALQTAIDDEAEAREGADGVCKMHGMGVQVDRPYRQRRSHADGSRGGARRHGGALLRCLRADGRRTL